MFYSIPLLFWITFLQQSREISKGSREMWSWTWEILNHTKFSFHPPSNNNVTTERKTTNDERTRRRHIKWPIKDVGHHERYWGWMLSGICSGPRARPYTTIYPVCTQTLYQVHHITSNVILQRIKLNLENSYLELTLSICFTLHFAKTWLTLLTSTVKNLWRIPKVLKVFMLLLHLPIFNILGKHILLNFEECMYILLPTNPSNIECK